ncbi:hypothetical protein CHS0354_041008 [Potamilus streckersoni]|uniref:Uncharacterized protein n=1 Tax=Potamilus streckersoni TaxID=2493646 RepID=A0AAE0SX37_9BIVA|nr:hypothetical protein CHS0354_041008 [Potamilus streckersoni]
MVEITTGVDDPVFLTLFTLFLRAECGSCVSGVTLSRKVTFAKGADHSCVFLNSIFGKQKMQFDIKPVTCWEQFIPGHIVEFSYYWIPHQGILSGVNPRERKIKVIHYGASHLFATRTIMEEEMTVDLNTTNFSIYYPDPRYSYTPEEVIRNGKRRLGEQDWRPGNHSDDFCLACVFR